MELWTAFILGLAGSAHCAGMCGPLALALPRSDGSLWQHLTGRICYNLGRVLTYCSLGVVFGLIGRSLATAGVQRWVSIALGVFLLAFVLLSRSQAFNFPSWGGAKWLRAALGKLIRKRSFSALALFGFLNGLLPCGLVYVAGAGAAATSGLSGAVLYMLVFGLGTVPMMLALSLAGTAIQGSLRLKLQKAIPFCLVLVALLLILRGLGLGIPYLSPDLSRGACCH